MVKKLFKYEIISYLRTLIPAEAVILGLGILTRLMQLFKSDSLAYTISFAASVTTFCLSVFVVLVLAFIIGIIRFYKNLFTQEGYLSFTLPVTAAQHIWVKLLTASMFQVLTFLVAVLSAVIAFDFETLSEICNGLEYFLQNLLEKVGGYNLCLFIAETIVLLLLLVMAEFLKIYLCIAIGQFAKKNRILLAVGVYFGFRFVGRILSTVLSIIFTILAQSRAFLAILSAIAAQPVPAIHFGFGIVFLPLLLFGTLCFFFSHLIIRQKLNLE